MTFTAHIGAGVIGAYLIDALIFHRPMTPETMGVAIGLSLLPDLDSVYVLTATKNWHLKDRNRHHRFFSHTPLFFLSLALLLTPFLNLRALTLFVGLTLLHLVLDSWATDDGIMWLWPFRERQYALVPIQERGPELFGMTYYRQRYFRQWYVALAELLLLLGGLLVGVQVVG